MKRIIVILVTMLLIFPFIIYSIPTFTIQETEKISLVPNASDPDLDKLTAAYSAPLNDKGEWQTDYGDAGEYNATITVSDGTTSVSKDVLIVVKKKEERPKIESFIPEQEVINIKEAEAINFKINATDVDKDKLSYDWFLDDKKIKDGQEFSYETTYKDAGSHKVSVIVSDGTSEISKEWKVNVEDVKRPLVFEPIENKVINENEELKIILNANDPDSEQITYSASNLPDDAKFDGKVFTWKPSFDTVRKEGFVDWVVDKFRTLSKSFYVQFAASSMDKKIVQNIIITVKDVNRAPVIEDLEPIKINEGETLRIAPKAYDPDGDKITLTYFGFINSDNYKSKAGDAGAYNVKVTASDGLLETAKFVQINISRINRPPVFEKIGDIKASEGDNIAILLKANDPDDDAITYSIDNPPEGSFLKGNVFLWTPSYNLANKKESKLFDLVFAASDGKTQTREIIKMEIDDKNRAPRIIDASKSVIARPRQPALMFVKAVDDDGDDLAYTWDFGFFDKYKATPRHQRIFTSRGAKVVKVIVSDGTDEVEQIINVNVV